MNTHYKHKHGLELLYYLEWYFHFVLSSVFVCIYILEVLCEAWTKKGIFYAFPVCIPANTDYGC